MKPALRNIDLDLGKILPQSVDIEIAVLGAILNDKNSLSEISDILIPDAFYKEENQKIFSAILELDRQDKQIDILTVTEELRKRKELDEIGGALYISQLLTNVISSAHILEHAMVVKEKYLLRELIRVSSELNQRAYDDSVDISDIIDYSNQLFDDFNEMAAGKSCFKHLSGVLNQVMEVFQKREALAKEGKLVGLRTPLKKLNEFTGGWRSELIVIAARPGAGKSAWALALAKTLAFENIPICIYSLEMSDYSLAERLIYAEADMSDGDIYKANHGYMDDTIWVKIKRAKSRLEKLPIYIDDNSCVDVNYIKSHSRIMHKKGLCKIIIIDYIQLTGGKRERGKSKAEMIGDICKELRTLRKNLDIPIILLSQLNRDLEKRGSNKRPQLSDIKESGSIEESADMIMFIHREAYYKIAEDDQGNSTEGIGELIIAKNKNGPVDTIKFSHNNSLTKIFDYSPIKVEKEPEKIETQQKLFEDNLDDVPF